MKDSAENKNVSEFIKCLSEKDFAKANNALELAIRDKTKNLIKDIKENK